MMAWRASAAPQARLQGQGNNVREEGAASAERPRWWGDILVPPLWGDIRSRLPRLRPPLRPRLRPGLPPPGGPPRAASASPRAPRAGGPPPGPGLPLQHLRGDILQLSPAVPLARRRGPLQQLSFAVFTQHHWWWWSGGASSAPPGGRGHEQAGLLQWSPLVHRRRQPTSGAAWRRTATLLGAAAI